MADVHAVHGRRLELPGRRPDVLGLAMTVGLLLFLFAEAVPRGFSGPQGFWIGAGGLVALVVVVLLIAVTVDNARSHRRSSADEGLDDFGFTRLAEQIQGLHATLADDATANLADLLRRWDSIALPDRTREVQYLAERAGFWSDEELKGLMMLLGRASASQRALLTFLVKGRP
jgi:hypothetical protein